MWVLVAVIGFAAAFAITRWFYLHDEDDPEHW